MSFFNGSFILLDAAAAPAGGASPQAAAGGLIEMLVPFALIFVVFYFLLIRPQQKKQKELAKMIEELKRGDEVITSAGIHGTIKAVTPHNIKLEIAQNTVITIEKSQIAIKKAAGDGEPEKEKSDKKLQG